MISVTRTAKPAILVANEALWLAELLAATSPEERKAKQDRYRHVEIKLALEAMFHGKCAFCEACITHVAYSDIEHFRPKAHFEHLTFVWENLLLACPRCNQGHKRDHFPLAPDGTSLLLDPTKDNPTEHLHFRWHAQSNTSVVLGKTTRGRTTRRLLGLNRSNLRDERDKQVKRLAVLATYATSDPKAKQILCEAMQANHQFAAFARALAIQHGISCDPAP
ncbi:retron system putative HNH endonuclease [Armatimonas rosea]|uniref:Uncharacterized protein (TIGR02646 family) n=1 Tax=Armatimonas rosea TaxID=685828 RepID=A0A7W9SWI9_ARMRO|nr:retron system putative HNH endonuclease [Armatimonas rosea]MBB6053665.1 uncharacterized protein (TIGR02646 family) [Armatimonas rosea]